MLSDMQVRALLAKNHVRGRMNSCSLILPITKKKKGLPIRRCLKFWTSWKCIARSKTKDVRGLERDQV